MPNMLVSKVFVAKFGEELKAVAAAEGASVEFVTLPDADGARMSAEDCRRIDAAYIDRDIRFHDQWYPAFGAAVSAAGNLKWLHFVSSGISQHKFVPALVERGVKLTTSTGSNAEPVAQTGFTGLMMLARGFPGFIIGQRLHEWRPQRGAAVPPDVRGQTVVIIGMGSIGKIFAGYCQAFGMKVIGVRRSPLQPGDPVDEMQPVAKLAEVLPRADWVVIACPLTKETRHLISADMLKRMKPSARLINVARGEVVDEEALIEALKNKTIAGAHLDVTTQEPLPAESPLWDMPNVIVTPHNASASAGNDRRGVDILKGNFGRWLRGESMVNEVQPGADD